MKTPKIMTVIDELLSYEEHIFRGENKHYCEVSSKLYREYHGIIHDKFSVLDIQKDLIERARPHIRPDASDIEVLTELQHYGGQTALIDFTTNALIALFFACYGEVSKDSKCSKDSECNKDGECSENGRIIILKNPDLLPEDIKDNCPYRRQPSGKSPRVIFQSSVFVQIATGYLKEGSEEDRYEVIKIEQGHKEYFLAYLKQSFGIDADTIYNDIHGFIQNKDNNTTADTEFYRGYSYFKDKQYAQAIEHYKNVIKLRPANAEDFYFRGVAYNNKGEYKLAIADFNKAIADFNKAIALNPDFAEAFNNRGATYNNKSKYDLAIADFNKAIALRPDFAEAFCNRGLAYFEKGKYELAIDDYNKAIALKLDYAEAFYNRGIAYGSKGEDDPAIADLNQAIQLLTQQGKMDLANKAKLLLQELKDQKLKTKTPNHDQQKPKDPKDPKKPNKPNKPKKPKKLKKPKRPKKSKKR